MKLSCTFACLLVVIVATFGLGAHAQAPAQQVAASAAHQPMDLKSTKLDPSTQVRGHDAKRIVAALDSPDLKKGEYESDTAFKKRLQGLGTKPLYDGLKLGDAIALKPKEVTYSYDANAQQWTYQISYKAVRLAYNHYVLERQQVPVENFLKMAFPGRRMQSYKTITMQMPEFKGINYIRGSAKVPAASAPQLKGKLSVLAVGHIAPGYMHKDEILPMEPSDDRYEEVEAIHFKVSAFWLINEETGEVLSKQWTRKTV